MALDETERACWIALAATAEVGAGRHGALLSHFRSARRAWTATAEELLAVRGVGPRTIEAITAARGAEPLVAARRLAASAENGPWRVLCRPQQEYPGLLRKVYDPPAALWVRGRLPTGPAVAIVGSRSATPYGLKVARRLAADLAASGVAIVSGLARGIDTAAHKGALDGGGLTVAVLGCGIDRVYPPENRSLAAEIAATGALISELPPGFRPLRGHFPARNRLISGLAAVTVVVEAGERSGALITADLALEQGREVMAVPGEITSPLSAGCNLLLADGAPPVLCAADIIDALRKSWLLSADQRQSIRGPVALGEPSGSCRQAGGTRAERILASLSVKGSGLDEIVAATGLAVSEVLAELTALQLSGRVEGLPGGRFVSFSQLRR